MTTEAGAKNGIVEPDQKVVQYLEERGATNVSLINGDDDDAEYSKIFEYEASEMEPIVAKPFSPENTSVVRETTSVELDKAYIGSCTGAKYEDLKPLQQKFKRQKSKNSNRSLTCRNIYLQKSNGKRIVTNLLGLWCDCWASYVWCLLWRSHGCACQR